MWAPGPSAADQAGEETCTQCHGTRGGSQTIGEECSLLGPGLITSHLRALSTPMSSKLCTSCGAYFDGEVIEGCSGNWC